MSQAGDGTVVDFCVCTVDLVGIKKITGSTYRAPSVQLVGNRPTTSSVSHYYVDPIIEPGLPFPYMCVGSYKKCCHFQ